MNELQQGTPEWLELRKTKITATDSAVILGLSPYKTPLELWNEKKGIIEPSPINQAMRFGSAIEEDLRKEACELTGIEFFPYVAVPNNDYIMASLDGIDFDKVAILEIKYTNKKYFEDIKKGNVPLHFFAQVQKQFICVPTAKIAYLYVANGDDRYMHTILPNEAFIEEIKQADLLFYTLLQDTVPPPKSEKDYVLVEDEPELKELLDEWETIKSMKKTYEAREKELKMKILAYTDDGNCRAYGFKITKSYCNTHDYKKACEEAEISLEKYVKINIKWFIKREKDNE